MSETTAQTEIRSPTDPESPPFLQIRNITKRFGAFVAVDNVSLDIHQGELFCLLGGSGSGKSTLLRMLSGFETPSSGQILIAGKDQAGVPPYKRDTNMMFQSYALFPHMTVEKNIAYGLKREGVPRAEIATRVTDMLSLVKLNGFAARKPNQLSGGQRQRVALARSLIKRPKLLLLDEPLGALDKKLREETQFELIKIQETLGVTFVVVTHDQEEAMTLSTRMGVMADGKLVQVGAPHEIYEYPRSRFVAEFIGSVNIFEGRIEQDGEDHAVIGSPDAGMGIYLSHGITGTLGQEVAVAVRPEKIRIGKSPMEDLPNTTQGTVDEVAYMGNLSVFHVRLETGKIISVSQSNLVRSPEDAITWGDRVTLGWDGAASVVVPS